MSAPFLAPAPSSPAARAGLLTESAAEASAGAVLPIMPGKIVRVMVEPGQQVEEGASVHVKPGDDVEKDPVLVEIE